MMGPIYGYFTPAELEESQREAANRTSAKASVATPTPVVAVPGSLTDEQIAKEAYAQCFKASEISPQGVQLYLFDVKRLGAFIDALATTSTAAQPGEAS